MEEFEKLKENKILNDKFRKQMINYLKTNRKLMIEELETRKGKKPIEMIERLHKIKF